MSGCAGKFEKLNITVQQGYPSHTSETVGLNGDQFVNPPVVRDALRKGLLMFQGLYLD